MTRKLALLIPIFVVLSCGSLRHYRKVATDKDVTAEKKAVISGWVAEHFPVTPEYIKGDDVIVTDTVYDTHLVDSLTASIDSLILNQLYLDVDSLKAQIRRECKPKTIYRTKIRVDTVKVVDDNLVTSLQSSLDSAKAKNIDLEFKLVEAENKKGNSLYYIVGAFVVAGVQAYMMAKRRKKK